MISFKMRGTLTRLCSSMQALRFAVHLSYCLLAAIPVVWADSQDTVRQADSLFAAGNEADAAQLYETAIARGHTVTDPMLLKLARAYEQQGDVLTGLL